MGRRFVHKVTGKILSPRRRRTGRNGTPWYAYPRGERTRKPHTYTLSADEFRWLGWLATYYGENQSRTLGLLIREERRRIAKGGDLE